MQTLCTSCAKALHNLCKTVAHIMHNLCRFVTHILHNLCRFVVRIVHKLTVQIHQQLYASWWEHIAADGIDGLLWRGVYIVNSLALRSGSTWMVTNATSPSLPLMEEPLVEAACTRREPSCWITASKLLVFRELVRSVAELSDRFYILIVPSIHFITWICCCKATIIFW